MRPVFIRHVFRGQNHYFHLHYAAVTTITIKFNVTITQPWLKPDITSLPHHLHYHFHHTVISISTILLLSPSTLLPKPLDYVTTRFHHSHYYCISLQTSTSTTSAALHLRYHIKHCITNYLHTSVVIPPYLLSYTKTTCASLHHTTHSLGTRNTGPLSNHRQ